MEEQKSHEELLNEAVYAPIILGQADVVKLKTLLINYCQIYYSSLPIFSDQNKIYLDNALDWAIKRVEQKLNPRTSNVGSLVIGDGTWLANAKNYYDTLVQSKPDIGDYLKEYTERVLNNTSILNNDTPKARR